MNYLLLLIICCPPFISAAQDVREQLPAGVTIVKYKWEPASAGPSVDPSMKAESDSPSSDSSGTGTQDTQFGERQTFVYSTEIKNNGPKAITAVRWDYVIAARNTSEELGRHEFENIEKIGRDKTKRLMARSRVSPTRVIQIQGAEKTVPVERVVIKCVVYEDGSVWQQAGTPSQLCEGIRKRASN